jgi:RHS repeat-associated protein
MTSRLSLRNGGKPLSAYCFTFRNLFDTSGALFLLVAALLICLMAPAPAHAQSGSQYGWYPAQDEAGTACWLDSNNAVRCLTPQDACESLAIFYSLGGPVNYAYVFPSQEPVETLQGQWVPGLSCANLYTGNFVAGLSLVFPTGVTPDSNSPTGLSDSGTGTVQPFKQVGGGSCGGSDDQGDPDDNTPNGSATSDASGAESATPECAGTSTGNPFAGEPINIATGNMAYHTTDYKTAGQNPLTFRRYFNSRGMFAASGTLGAGWHSSYDRFIWIWSSTQAMAQRADGQQLIFNLVSGVWTPDSDVDYTLTKSGSTWTLHDPNDTIETYTTTTTGYAANYLAQLNTIQKRNGYTKTLAYNSTGQLLTITDSYGRVLTLSYNTNGTINTVTTADYTTITYGYSSGSVNLTSVSFSTSPVQTITYVYGNSNLPHTLTGVTDEDGNTYFTWTYDAYGRALTSTRGTGSNAVVTTVAYNDTNGSRTVTNSLGVTDTYSFSTLQNAQKVTSISRAATSTTAAATESFGYDSNGYLNSLTDWNGNQTTYVNNSHGKPTTINEAVGSSVARTTTIAYDSTWVHLPDTVTTPGVTTTFAYDSNGNVHTKTYTDTTTQSIPYSTNGQTRTWTFGYTNFLLTSVQTPRTDVTAITDYAYAGATLSSITDALGHVTNVTQAQTGGYPQTVVDPNNVTRIFSWDARQRLVYDVVDTSAGNYTTYFNLDPTGELSQIFLPDGTYRNYAYDAAHRMTKVTDPYSSYIQYSLDALGDATQAEIENGSTEYANHTATFDALGRKLTDVGGQGQTTTFTYDKDGNALTIKDGVGNTTTRVFDALNRLSKSTDANSGVAQWTYDAHNRPLTVEDQNSHTTSYVYNGFGDVIQQTSPDTGTTVYHYDNNGNLTSKTDAASVVTNQTFDKLDRVLTTSFPADSTLNVAYTYDQTGTGFSFGIGRLTSLTDQAGSLTRAYDERGNLLTEKRVNSGTTYTTSYTYNQASRIISTTYPDGTLVGFGYDGPGTVYIMAVTPAGSSTQTMIAPNINHFPFGPLQYISYGNGMTETWFFDLDYRVTAISANMGNINQPHVMQIDYAYDAANNLKTITDNVNGANSQTLGYDVLNRINSAVSGTGGYGTLGWTYDANGNLVTRVSGGTTYTHTYNTGTNQDAGATWPSNTETFSYTATGNINGETLNGTSIFTATYSKANRLATESGSALSTAVTGIVYDAFGRRFSKAHSSGSPELYFYDQKGEVIAENISGTYTDYVFVDGMPLAVVSPTASPAANQIAYVTTDRIGTPQMVFNSASTPTNIWSNTYQPYGQGGIPTSSIVNDTRLPGQTYDAETGFHYNLNRDYIPSLGRYLEADPIGLRGGLNPYLYAKGNPSSYLDRNGENPLYYAAAIAFVGGAILGAYESQPGNRIEGGLIAGSAAAATVLATPYVVGTAVESAVGLGANAGTQTVVRVVAATATAGNGMAAGTAGVNIVNGNPWDDGLGRAQLYGLGAGILSLELPISAAATASLAAEDLAFSSIMTAIYGNAAAIQDQNWKNIQDKLQNLLDNTPCPQQ